MFLSFLLAMLFLNLAGVGHALAQGLLDPTQMSPELQHLVRARGDEIVRTWAHRCNTQDPRFAPLVGFPAKNKSFELRLKDFVLYSGLLCFAGEGIGCTFVKQSMGASGQVWRTPVHKELDDSNQFSRDMMLGVSLYLLATKDRTYAVKYAAYLESRRGFACVKDVQNDDLDRQQKIDKCLPKVAKQWGEIVLGSGCPNADDSKCTVMPTIWDSFFYVYKAIGVAPSPSMILSNTLMDLPWPVGDSQEIATAFANIDFKSKLNRSAVTLGKAFASLLPEGSPLITFRQWYMRDTSKNIKKGYELHLKAVQGLLYQATGQREAASETLKNVYEREPTNPFFEMLRVGTNDAWAQRFAQYCPESIPVEMDEKIAVKLNPQNLWFLEVDQSIPASYQLSKNIEKLRFPIQALTGWECQLLAKLAFKRLPLSDFPSQSECKIPVYSTARSVADSLACSQYTRKTVNLLARL
jgi:hypothetical protein